MADGTGVWSPPARQLSSMTEIVGLGAEFDRSGGRVTPGGLGGASSGLAMAYTAEVVLGVGRSACHPFER